jgi:hypothetical protein
LAGIHAGGSRLHAARPQPSMASRWGCSKIIPRFAAPESRVHLLEHATVINSWAIPKPVIFRILGLDLALGAGPDREVVRMTAAEGTAAAVLQSIGTRAVAICSLPLRLMPTGHQRRETSGDGCGRMHILCYTHKPKASNGPTMEPSRS